VSRHDLRVAVGRKKVPFSAGQIVEGLQAAGALTDDALRVVRDVEERLRERDERTVPLERLQRLVAARARELLGEEVAQHWEMQTPPFVPIVLERHGGEVARFSRRTLTASLEKLGLGFKEAWSLASLVEQGVRAEGLTKVREAEIPQRVALALEARYGREQRLRYESMLGRPADLMVVEPDGSEVPYSRGILARSLTSIGLAPELSHQLAKRAEEQLWRTVGSRAQRDDVRDTVRELLVQEAGEEFARRYELMRVVRRPERPILVLVGGTAGVGKSELAAELAYRLGVVRVVSSDSVRQALRSLISPDLSPVLHASSYTAWLAELLPEERAHLKPKRKRVIRGFQAQCLQLATALGAIGERSVSEATSMVIEGIHLVPGVGPERPAGATVVELMLYVEDEDLHRSRFATREGRTGTRRPRTPYLEHFEEIRLLQDWLVGRADEAGVPLIDVADLDEAVERAVEAVLDVVLAESERELDVTVPAESGAAAS
jgi:2-phosphoglycerate kinase